MELKINENVLYKNCVFKDRCYNYFLINILLCLICYNLQDYKNLQDLFHFNRFFNRFFKI